MSELRIGTAAIGAEDLAAARSRIAEIAVATPVLPSDELAARAGVPVWLKLENLQRTGSFKVRGAANCMLSLDDAQRKQGVVTCSSGNHGKAVSYVARRLGVHAVVCVPSWVDPAKLAAIRRNGAETILHGDTYDEADERSLEIGRERGLTYVHPFDDPAVIAGQGTIGLEIVESVPDLAAVLVPLSGGGLLAGVAAAVKHHDPRIRVIGVSAENARVMHESLRVGHPVALPEVETIATALAGGIGLDNRYTFATIQALVDEHAVVTESELAEAMGFAATQHRMIVEGGGAPGIAAVLSQKTRGFDGPVAVVVSGGNIDLDVWAAALPQPENG